MRAEEAGSARCVELSRNNRSSPDLTIKGRAGAPARAPAPLASAPAVTADQPRSEPRRPLHFCGDSSSRF